MVTLAVVLSISVRVNKFIKGYISLCTGNFLSVNFTEQQIFTFFGILYEISSCN